MIATVICALLIVGASVVVGRATMLALGWRRPEWLGAGVGFAVLVVLAPLLVRLPGEGLTAAVLLALLVAGCAIVTRRSVPERSAGDESEQPRAQHAVALAVVPVVIALACLPFLFNERAGVLGEGIYTNDQAAQLYWADWLATGFGPQPNAVSFGYPVGPQALAASVSEGTGADLVAAFNGLLLAIPALTALAALSVLSGLAPWRRGIAAALTGLPYLGASFLAQSGFKETAMALFVVVMAAVLHVATVRARKGSEPPVRAIVGVLALIAAAAVFTFSIPGGVWFGISIPAWALLWFLTERDLLARGNLRDAVVRHRRVLTGSIVALLILAAVALGPASGFIEKIDDVQESSGRLSSPVFPGEALGIWPEGDFRIVRGEVGGALLATGFAALCALGAVIALMRRREWALLAALGGAAFVYALTRPFAQIHVEAKALAVLAPIAMLVIVRWLLGRGDGSLAARARLAAGALFVVLAFGSTLLALRAAPVGFDERQRALEELAERVGPDDDLVFLGVDRFAGYYLRGTHMRSPAGYVPSGIKARGPKTWQQGLAVDFDTLEPKKLNRQDYAITTAAAYASTPPETWREVARASDYVLWKRVGKGPDTRVLDDEGGDPGAVLRCVADEGPPGTATVLERPVVGEQEAWQPGFHFEAPGEASQVLTVPAGGWDISLQYHSQVPLVVKVDEVEVARLPASLEGFYLIGAGRGAFWPAGEFPSDGGGAKVTVEATAPSGLQEALGVKRSVWLGTVALSAKTPPRTQPMASACGEYVDHYTEPGR